MSFQFSPQEKALALRIGEAADNLNLEAYIVGGYVRDRILGRPCQDIDIVCVGDGVALAQEVGRVLNIKSEIVIFKRFGTAMLRFGDLELEFVGARKESYSRDSRKPDVTPGSLEDDQNRRDFTINAMAVCINKNRFGELLDPFGGIAHLEEKLIRTPLEPDKTFSDDPLRMMRAVRFAAQLKYTISPETFDSIKRNRERLRIISMERIMTELNKIILSDKPSVGLNLLSESGLLGIFFPEFENLRGVEVINGQGHKDNYYHTLKVLDNLSTETNDLWLRWAAILHDIAKPPTKRYVDGLGWTFHGHEVVGARWVPRIFKRFKLPLDNKMKYVQKLVRLHLRPISLTNDAITDSAMRRLLFDAGDDIDDLMMLCKADITSKNELKVKRIKSNYEKVKIQLSAVEEKDKIRNWQPPISGEDIMKTFSISPSKQVGVLKDLIREAILDGIIPNDYNSAYAYMLQEGKALGLTVAVIN